MKVYLIWLENENETKKALGVFYTKESAELYLKEYEQLKRDSRNGYINFTSEIKETLLDPSTQELKNLNKENNEILRVIKTYFPKLDITRISRYENTLDLNIEGELKSLGLELTITKDNKIWELTIYKKGRLYGGKGENLDFLLKEGKQCLLSHMDSLLNG